LYHRRDLAALKPEGELTFRDGAVTGRRLVKTSQILAKALRWALRVRGIPNRGADILVRHAGHIPVKRWSNTHREAGSALTLHGQPGKAMRVISWRGSVARNHEGGGEEEKRAAHP
jgi:hypothetical protein